MAWRQRQPFLLRERHLTEPATRPPAAVNAESRRYHPKITLCRVFDGALSLHFGCLWCCRGRRRIFCQSLSSARLLHGLRAVIGCATLVRTPTLRRSLAERALQ